MVTRNQSAYIEICAPSMLTTLFQDNISAFFGGYAVYYLGIYSYGTNVSRPKDRAYRLARLDGVETVALVVGTLISPKVHKNHQ